MKLNEDIPRPGASFSNPLISGLQRLLWLSLPWKGDVSVRIGIAEHDFWES